MITINNYKLHSIVTYYHYSIYRFEGHVCLPKCGVYVASQVSIKHDLFLLTIYSTSTVYIISF